MDERVRGTTHGQPAGPGGGVPGPSAAQALLARVAEALSAEDGSRRGIIAAIEVLVDALASEVVAPPVTPAGPTDRTVGLVDEGAVLDSVGELERLGWRLSGERLRCIAALEARQSWLRFAATSTAALLAKRSPSSYGRLRHEVDDAVALARLPETSASLVAGDLDPRHVRTATDTLAQLDADPELAEDPQARDRASRELDALLREHGPGATPSGLRRRVDDWQAARGKPSKAERERRAHARRWLRLSGPAGKLSLSQLRGELDAVTYARLRAFLDAHARPHSEDDERTDGQRNVDALADLLDSDPHAAVGAESRAGGLRTPAVSGRAQVLVITSPEALAGAEEALASELDGYGPVGSATAQRIACDAEVTEVFWRADGKLNVGRRRRTPTRRLRAAVVARDRRCVGCAAPATRCEVHHIQWWRYGGRTDLENLTLLCGQCHHRVHHDGFTVVPQGQSFRLDPPPRSSPAPDRGGAAASAPPQARGSPSRAPAEPS